MFMSICMMCTCYTLFLILFFFPAGFTGTLQLNYNPVAIGTCVKYNRMLCEMHRMVLTRCQFL